MTSEIAKKTNFDTLRYGMCWEDADILLNALNIQPTDNCLSIASAGDNTFAMLAQNPQQLVALDLNPTQLAALELRYYGYQQLTHPEFLQLLGVTPSMQRGELYKRIEPLLTTPSKHYWQTHNLDIQTGIIASGRFEQYFAKFRTILLPYIHNIKTIEELLTEKPISERKTFYDEKWNNWQWRLLFRVFFSKTVMGKLGRDPAFFQYVQGSVADKFLTRTKYAMTELNPADNPYLQWLLTGTHTTALPYALRQENFNKIKNNLHKLTWHCQAIEDYLATTNTPLHKINLSDIFEYMSPTNHENILTQLTEKMPPGSRLAYWNMLVPRSRPTHMQHSLQPLTQQATALYQQDKAFFYSNFIIEERCHA